MRAAQSKALALGVFLASSQTILGCAAVTAVATDTAVTAATLSSTRADVRIAESLEQVEGCRYLRFVRASSASGGLFLQGMAREKTIAELTEMTKNLGGNVLLLKRASKGFEGAKAEGSAYRCPSPTEAPLAERATVMKHPDGTHVWVGLFRVKPPVGPGWSQQDLGDDGVVFTSEGETGGMARVKATPLAAAVTGDDEFAEMARRRCDGPRTNPSVSDAKTEILPGDRSDARCMLCRQQLTHAGPPGAALPPVVQRSADWLCLHPRKPSLAVSIVYMAQAAAEDYAQGRAPHLGAPFDEAAAAFFAGFAFEE